MKLLLFGAGGQVGKEVCAGAAAVDVVAPARAQTDLAIPGAAAEAVLRAKPDAVVNAAAWTAVDAAESARQAAFRINAEAADEIAAAAARAGARLVHLSTDYVFPGDRAGPLAEEAPTGPLNVYGETKLEGERRVQRAHPAAVILRTSWVYSTHGSNFVKTMLRLAERRDQVDVVADQRGAPTPASAIAEAALAIARRPDGAGGIFHFQGAPAASWADFAEAIFAAAGKAVKVNRIETSAYPTPARRPFNTVLDCSKIFRDYGIVQPDWRRDTVRIVERLMDQDAGRAL